MAAPSSSDTTTVERTDLDNHEFAQYILQEHGTYFPKFEDMDPFTESIPNLKQRINQTQEKHTAELEKLYAHQTAQYIDDALDRYAAQSDEANGDDYSDIIDELYSSRHGKSSFETRFDRETTLVRLAHAETIAQLQYKVAAKQREEESRDLKRREVQFPQTAAEFNTIHDKELQQRIARFLTSDAIVQDKMLNEYGWKWRQVQGLKEDYMKDFTFKEDIQRRVAVVRDPRRKPTLT